MATARQIAANAWPLTAGADESDPGFLRQDKKRTFKLTGNPIFIGCNGSLMIQFA